MPLISQFDVVDFLCLGAEFSITGAAASISAPGYLTLDHTTMYEIPYGPQPDYITSSSSVSTTNPVTITPSPSSASIGQIVYTNSGGSLSSDTYIAGIENNTIPANTYIVSPTDIQFYFIFAIDDGVSLFFGNTASGYTVNAAADNILLANNGNDIKVSNNSGSTAYAKIGIRYNGADLEQWGEGVQTVLS